MTTRNEKPLQPFEAARNRKLAIVFALLSTLCAAVVFRSSQVVGQRSGPPPVPQSVRELERRLTDLERRVSAAALILGQPSETAAPDRTEDTRKSDLTVDDGISRTLEQRLASLERLADDLLKSPYDWSWTFGSPEDAVTKELIEVLGTGRDDFPHIDWLRSIGEACSMEAIQRLKALALDPSATVDQRFEAVAALKQLGARLDLGDLLLDDALCRGLLDSAARATDDVERSRLYASLSGSTHEMLRAPMLAAARTDPSPLVRDAVVSNLRRFLPDSEVESSLRWLRENDPDPGVRDEADEVLKGSKPD